MENPFYAGRKPERQIYSGLRKFIDVLSLSMGVALESNAVRRWLIDDYDVTNIVKRVANLKTESNNLKCFFQSEKGFTGISLGGHTAAICASVCPSAVPCIPAYCWSTSAGVWTRGALSNRINFKKLQVDINSNLDYDLFLKEIEPLGLRRWERKPTHTHNPIFCGIVVCESIGHFKVLARV